LPDDFAGSRWFSPGKRLPQAIQAKMESLFGTGFGDVRIHESPAATTIGALAFTQGSSIFFAPGQYNPNTPQGQRLLGQQLAHVVQQRSGRVRNPFGAGIAVVNDPLLKAEAEMMGARAAMAQSIQSKSQNGSRLVSVGQRQPPAPILPQRAGGTAPLAQASLAAPRPIMPSPPAPIVPSRTAQPIAMPAPILPAHRNPSLGTPPGAVQPKLSLAAIVARSRELFSSVTQVGRRVFGL
jgi:hypothetical protein